MSLAFLPAAQSQDLARQPTAFTAYLDFSKQTGDLPIWIERVEKQTIAPSPGQEEKTLYRVRFRRFPGLVDEVLMRVYFTEKADAQPVVSGWSEIGARVLPPRVLGQGIGLPSSETVPIPMAGVDYAEISVPGDGSNVRGILAVALRQALTREAMDFGSAPAVTDPFGNGEPAVTGTQDTLLFGRVKATLEPGLVPVGLGDDPGEVVYDFPLERPPLIALLTFEVLNADVSAPPNISVNGRDVGAVSLNMPDLADPALTGIVEAAHADVVYRYGGWLKCQKVIPGSLLTGGTNEIFITTPGQPAPVALRSVEVQLKYTPDASAP